MRTQAHLQSGPSWLGRKVGQSWRVRVRWPVMAVQGVEARNEGDELVSSATELAVSQSATELDTDRAHTGAPLPPAGREPPQSKKEPCPQRVTVVPSTRWLSSSWATNESDCARQGGVD